MGLGDWLRRATPKGATRALDRGGRVPVEQQVATLARLGLPPEGEVTLEQVMAADVDLMESHPYLHVLRRLGEAPGGQVRLHPRVVLERLTDEEDATARPLPEPPRGAKGLVPVPVGRGQVRLTPFVPHQHAVALRELLGPSDTTGAAS